MTPLMVPRYDAAILRDEVAYPSTERDARELLRALTGRECHPLDWEAVGSVAFELDHDRYRATYSCAGEWPDVGACQGRRVRMLVAVTDVHVMRLGS